MKSNKRKSTKKSSNLISNDHRGITLVALIITIIVMLILVGVSITIALNGGLFGTTKKVAKETEEAKRKEQELASGRIKIDGIWYDSLEDYAIGKQSEIQGIVDLDKNNTKFKYTPEGWTNGEVKVGIDTSLVSSGCILKYSTDNINWNEYKTEIPMNANGSIYAKLVDVDGKEGGVVTANVGNIDKEAPTVNTEINSTGAVGADIPLSINVTDSQSGISKIEWRYKLDTETDDKFITKTDIYQEMNGKEAGEKGAVTKEITLSDLAQLSTYNIYVLVYDVAGNSTRSPETGTINVATKKVIKPEVGDYVKYEPDTVTNSYSLLGKYSGHSSDQTIAQEKLDWQILKIYDDGSMDLIGTQTTNKVYFGGSLGYNNGVYLMHDICKELYSKPSEGIEARSVNLEDFEDEDNGGNWKEQKEDNISTKTYTGNNIYYPNLYARENGSGIDTDVVKTDGIKATDKGYSSPTEETYSTVSSTLTVTNTCYSIGVFESTFGMSAKVLLPSSSESEFWVAARCVNIHQLPSIPDFCLNAVWGNGIGGNVMFRGGDMVGYYNKSLRPIVTLDATTTMSIVDEGTSTSAKTFKITKY